MHDEDSSARNIIAYVAPFVVYVVPTLFESKGWLGLGYESVYTLKVLLVAALLWTFRRHYPPYSRTGFGIACAFGCVGIVIWIGLAKLQTIIPGVQALIDAVQGSRAAYDPYSSEVSPAFRTAFVIVRLIGLTLIVPVMEEVFWRGFLARYLISEDFRSVPQGTFTRFSFIAVTLAFASVHPELLAAITWGAMINELYRRTGNLWACVVMHAVTNGLLGAYVLATGSWWLW